MKALFTGVRVTGTVTGLALLVCCGSGVLQNWIARDEAAADHLVPALGLAGGLPDGLNAVAADEVAAIYAGVFHATVYYTPLESAFTEAAGFDMTPTTKPGLKGRSFPRDFLKSVALEGFGRMKESVDGRYYVSSCRGRWGFADAPVDSAGQPLRALQSTAVARSHEMVRSQASFRVRAAGLPAKFVGALWTVCDTGGGLKPGQIDFYWGEDAPLGPGAKLSRPIGMPDAIVKPTVVVLR